MIQPKSPKETWSEQFEAARDIKARYGTKAAFDYVVAEKLMNFGEAARRSADFAREMPAFVAAVRSLFKPEELSVNLARVERTLTEVPVSDPEEDDVLPDAPELVAERIRQFATIKDLLSTKRLGTA